MNKTQKKEGVEVKKESVKVEKPVQKDVKDTKNNENSEATKTPVTTESKVTVTKNEFEKSPIEALVPGYLTEQGEVLVPIDTVVGADNHITIHPGDFF